MVEPLKYIDKYRIIQQLPKVNHLVNCLPRWGVAKR